MNYREMFEKCKHNDNFIRVGPEYLNDIYLGYNSEGQETVVVVGESRQSLVKSTRKIHAEIKKRTDGRVSLEFSLLDQAFASVFYSFCDDVIKNTKGIDKARVIVHTLSRWMTWRKLFLNPKKGILSDSQIQGLIGELLMMKHYLHKTYGSETMVEGWLGPEKSPKDFYCDNTWYEIKAINLSKQSVIISSLEQLDSEDPGSLVVIRLQKVSIAYDKKITLNKLITSVIALIANPDILELFLQKLESVGYEYNEEYDSICYEYIRTDFYEVKEGFPIIRRNKIPEDILKVTYELSLVNIASERTEKWI